MGQSNTAFWQHSNGLLLNTGLLLLVAVHDQHPPAAAFPRQVLEELLPEVEAVGKRLAAEAAAARSQLDDVFAELATASLVCCNPACTTVGWGSGLRGCSGCAESRYCSRCACCFRDSARSHVAT